MATTGKRSFFETVRAAIKDISEHGFTDMDRVKRWMDEIARTARDEMIPEHRLEETLRDSLKMVFKRVTEKDGWVKFHKGVSAYTIERLKPAMRDALNKRILASANLIKLNREQSIAKTLQRFQGWASSVPDGGSDNVKRTKISDDVRKSIMSAPFEERRVLIDQGHKLTAAINDVVAKGNGAIAVIWRSHWRQANYDYREDHKERDGQIYLIRDSWAHKQGLVKANDNGYYDQITQAAEEPFCRCWVVYVYALRDIPSDMLTRKGEGALRNIKVA